ncbi:hypothetical protein J6590_036811 [Homalodisca vitripennis]|nr:hypothetical protein J6590_036811 [Homalodisca vitripennis]
MNHLVGFSRPCRLISLTQRSVIICSRPHSRRQCQCGGTSGERYRRHCELGSNVKSVERTDVTSGAIYLTVLTVSSRRGV